jgi:hypothetical protein
MSAPQPIAACHAQHVDARDRDLQQLEQITY